MMQVVLYVQTLEIRNKVKNDNPFSELHLANELEGIVERWQKIGWPGVTATTRRLFQYWFVRNESSERFHICQQRAIETVVYCHEILRIRTLEELYQKVVPALHSKPLLREIRKANFAKYCLKMASGTGKTWVLLALIIWQYFNSQNAEKPAGASGMSKNWYSCRFLVVAPGHEVVNRLLDAFKGRRDPATRLRNPSEAEYNNPLMMPKSWKTKFNPQIFEPSELRANTTSPYGPFIFITNWQQFELKKHSISLWETLTGQEIGKNPRGEFVADFLSEYPGIVIMNDEAHHVHSIMNGRVEELVWTKFIGLLRKRLMERHGDIGLFMQCDFSATPFFGSGTQRKYFVHIVYDYSLIEAMHAMLVKQLFFENRKQSGPEGLDFRAEREKTEHGKKLGDIIGLSEGQKLLLEMGRKKLESLSADFKSSQIGKKPVMMVLCEETSVVGMVKDYFQNILDPCNKPYDERKVMEIHTDLKDEQLSNARLRLDKIDSNDDQLNVIISVLMLREGFDRRNISVIVILRASEADLLLEQIIGRGLRLMFPRTESEIIWKSKERAFEDIKSNKEPSSSFDILFIVDHPRFEKFYQNLRMEGYLIGSGDISNVRTLGDIIPIEATPARISNYDIAWPVHIFEDGYVKDLSAIDVSKFRSYNTIQIFRNLQKSLEFGILDFHHKNDKKMKAWKFNPDVFGYDFFLSEASRAVAKDGKIPIFTSHFAEIARVIDEYVSNYLFKTKIDFVKSENFIILNYIPLFNFIVEQVRLAIQKNLGKMKYEYVGKWRRLSDVPRLMITEKNSIESNKTIYPRQGFSTKGDKFEKRFMLDVLEQSSEVLAYARVDMGHRLSIPYRDEQGILQEFGVDFIVKTSEKIYLIETTSDEVANGDASAAKATAAHNWCRAVSMFSPLGNMSQAGEWEYIVLSKRIFESNSKLSFNKFIPECKKLRNRIIKQDKKKLLNKSLNRTTITRVE